MSEKSKPGRVHSKYFSTVIISCISVSQSNFGTRRKDKISLNIIDLPEKDTRNITVVDSESEKNTLIKGEWSHRMRVN